MPISVARNRWFQFSLRALFWLILVVALVIASANRQIFAAAMLWWLAMFSLMGGFMNRYSLPRAQPVDSSSGSAGIPEPPGDTNTTGLHV